MGSYKQTTRRVFADTLLPKQLSLPKLLKPEAVCIYPDL